MRRRSAAVSKGETQCHRQRPIRGELGQCPVTGIAYLQRGWANWKPSVVLIWGNCGPSRGRRQYLGVGQPLATGSTALERFWAIRRPTQCHRKPLIRGELGQFPVIGTTYVQRSWANWKLSVVLLWGNSGPSRGRRQHLGGGQPLPTCSTALE
jgi:hypothetical protein